MSGRDLDHDLAPEERARLVQRFGRSFAAGESLFREGDPAREAFLLQEGRVRLLKRVRMIERSLMVLRPGDLFGEAALLDDGTSARSTAWPTPEADEDRSRSTPGTSRTSTAVALTDGIVLALDRTTFRPLMSSHPSIATRVTEQLIRRVRDAEDQIEIMLLRDAQSKIVGAILKLVRGTEGAAELSVSPVELSTRVGLDVDTVKRQVQRLREQQYLRIVGERVEIPDIDALRRLYQLLGTKEELRGDLPAR